MGCVADKFESTDYQILRVMENSNFHGKCRAIDEVNDIPKV